MARPPAPAVTIRRWTAGSWAETPDAVVTEEPLQLLLNGEKLAVVMRTPGQDVELALGLLFAEGIVRSLGEVSRVRVSAEADEQEGKIAVEPAFVESNQVDVVLKGMPRRKPDRPMLASSACGVCGAQVIEDLKRDLARLPDGDAIDPAILPGLVDKLREGQGVFERTGGLHAAGLFSARGELVHLREDIGRHNAVDKVVGRLLLDADLPATSHLLVVSGRAGYEIVQKSITAGIPLLAAVGAPSSLAVAMGFEFNQTLIGFLRGDRFNVYSGATRLLR